MLRKALTFVLLLVVFLFSVGLAANVGIWLYTLHDAYRDRKPVTGRVSDGFPLAVVSTPENASEPIAMLISNESFRNRAKSGSAYSLFVPSENTKLDTQEYDARGSGWVAEARSLSDPESGRQLVEVTAYLSSPDVRQIAGWYEVHGDSYQARYDYHWFQGTQAVAGMVSGTMAGIALWVMAGVAVEFRAWRRAGREETP